VKDCLYCHRPITEDVVAEKKRRKVANALASVEKAKRNGTKVGPKKKRDDEQIKRLRAKGLSMRAIAKEIGMSTGSVQKGLK
jgi:DNA-binding NarL/FixJ family response regulator